MYRANFNFYSVKSNLTSYLVLALIDMSDKVIL